MKIISECEINFSEYWPYERFSLNPHYVYVDKEYFDEVLNNFPRPLFKVNEGIKEVIFKKYIDLGLLDTVNTEYFIARETVGPIEDEDKRYVVMDNYRDIIGL